LRFYLWISTKVSIIAAISALTMKTKDWFCPFDLLGLRRQSMALLLVNLFWKTNCRSRRIKSRTKAGVVATGLAALNMMAGVQARSRISRLRHCDLTPMSGITFLLSENAMRSEDPCTDWFRPVARRNSRAERTGDRPRTRKECLNMTNSKTTKQLLVKATGVVALNIILTGAAFGQTTWTGAQTTSWFDGGNWSNGVPTAAANATINTSTLNPTVVPTGAAEALSINLGSTGTGNLTIESGASLTTSTNDFIGGSSPGTVTVTGSWTNKGVPFSDGLITVGSGSAQGTLTISNGGTVNDATGTVAGGGEPVR
jgi:T5SS/PEP-CTERM-associated repeat protein